MMSNMFAEFKTDIMQSVTETVESSINEWYEENDYSAEDEPVVDNTIDVNALIQTVLASDKSLASTHLSRLKLSDNQQSLNSTHRVESRNS